MFSVDISAQCSHPDYPALMQLFDSTDGDQWSFKIDWQRGKSGDSCDPCYFEGSPWYGIECNDSNRVVKIDLSNNKLKGELPDLDLPYLEELEVSSNDLIGPLRDFQNMPALKFLNTSHNDLSGPIPNFSNLENLEFWGSIHTNLTGDFPSLDGLPNIRFIDIGNNLLDGTIPEIRDKPFLELFYVNSNMLTGPIPTFTNCNALLEIFVMSNNLTGPIPDFATHSNLSELEFRAHSNNLEGCFPASVCEMKRCILNSNPLLPNGGLLNTFCGEGIQFAEPCVIDGKIGTIQDDCTCLPTDCESVRKDYLMLKEMYLALNGEAWVIPDTNSWVFNADTIGRDPFDYCDPCSWYGVMCENGRVVGIDFDGVDNDLPTSLSGINMQGEMPELDLPFLRFLNLNGNDIGGTFNNLSQLESLEELYLIRNEFSGNMDAILEFNNLKVLRASYNKLSGPIPDVSGLNNIEIFTCAFNELIGCFTDDLCAIDLLDLNGNTLMPWEGDITQYCEGESQVGAPCADENSNSTGFINEDCECMLTSSFNENATVERLQNKISIHPNPARNVIHISEWDKFVLYKILNLEGKLILSGSLSESAGVIDVSSLISGAYILNVIDHSGQTNAKMFMRF